MDGLGHRKYHKIYPVEENNYDKKKYVEKNKTDFTNDGFLNGAVQVLQPKKGYRAAVDSVLLAASIKGKIGDKMLDVGFGCGVVSLCLAARIKNLNITGIEIEKKYVTIGKKNIQKNGYKWRLYLGDICEKNCRILKREKNTFDHVFSNPPYFETNVTQKSTDPMRAIADSIEPDMLKLWINTMIDFLKPNGKFTMIHQPKVIPVMLKAFRDKMGDVVIIPICPKKEKPATRIIVQATKGSHADLNIKPPIILHKKDNQYTKKINNILRQPCAL